MRAQQWQNLVGRRNGRRQILYDPMWGGGGVKKNIAPTLSFHLTARGRGLPYSLCNQVQPFGPPLTFTFRSKILLRMDNLTLIE